MKINELKSKINELQSRMTAISETAELTPELREEFDGLIAKRDGLRKDLQMKEEVERMTLETIRNEDDGESRGVSADFNTAFREYIKTGFVPSEFRGESGIVIPESYRADPILTSTNTALVRKTVENSLSMVTGDNFSLLQALGVQFLPGLTGIVELPWMGQLKTSKPAEGADASTADAAPLNVQLAPQAYSSFQNWSKQALLTMPDAVYAGVISDMQMSNEREVVADYFNAILATDASVAPTAAGLTYKDMISMTKIPYNIGGASFVTANDVRVYLETKAVDANGIALAWNSLNNTIGGRAAISSDAVKDGQAIYGNHSFGVVGSWGTPELIINPYSQDTAGKIRVTQLGFYKPAIRNTKAFKYFSADASIG
jgi:hypothetical protein